MTALELAPGQIVELSGRAVRLLSQSDPRGPWLVTDDLVSDFEVALWGSEEPDVISEWTLKQGTVRR